MNQQVRGLHTKPEIMSQPAAWMASLQRLQRLDASAFPNIADYDQVIYSGCGSTYFLARWAASVSESVKGTISRAAPASELLLFPDAWWHTGKKNLLVAISRSGETTETVRATVRFIAEKLGDVVVITCYPQCPLARITPQLIALPDAQERSVAQTRSFTSMLLAVIWLIVRRIPDKLPEQFALVGQRLLERHAQIAAAIGRDDSLQRFFFLGSGAQYGLANEAMLKMKEMSLTYAESFHFHEFRHGPMSVVDENSLILGLLNGSAGDQQRALFREMKLLGARTLGLQDRADSAPEGAPDLQINFESSLPEIWQAPLYLPILQLIAFERAMHKGLDPDRPTNLTSVVVLDEHAL
jgi:glucosamine--fructose-6-phosphate aminotransferase (isomerizing)